MKGLIEVINRPADAFHGKNASLAWTLVLITVIIVVIVDAIFGWMANPSGSLIRLQDMLLTLIMGGISYLAVSSVLYLTGRIWGSTTVWKKYISSWGLTFIPNLICALIVAYTEHFYSFFYKSSWWGVIFSIIFAGILFWKVILYLIYLNEVAGLRGARLFGGFVTGTIAIAVLLFLNMQTGLKTPIL